jgi:hypothetical protein
MKSASRQRPEPREVPVRLPEHEVEVHGGDGGALQRGGRVADEDRLEPRRVQRGREALEQRAGVHGASTLAREAHCALVRAARVQ